MRVEQKPEEKKLEKFVPSQPLNKVIVLAVLVVGSTALFWLAWHNALVTGLEFNLSTQNIIVVVSTLLAFCLMLCLMAVVEVLITKNWIEFIVTILAAATIFIFFKPSLWSLIAFLLMILGFMYWRREVRIDEKTRTKFMPRRIINAGLKMAVTIILLSACFSYYSFIVTKPQATNEITDNLVDTGGQAVHNVLEIYYKDSYSPSLTLDEFIITFGFMTGADQLIKEKIGEETGLQEIDEIIEQGLTAAEGEAMVMARNDLLETFGVEAAGDEEMSVVVEKIVRKNINQYVEPYVKFIPALIAIGMFFVLNIFSFIYRELTKSFSYLLFHILVWLKFIKVEKIKVEAEKITL